MYKKSGNLVSMRRRPNREPKEDGYNTGGKSESKVYNSVLDLVGNTPLVKLNKVPRDYKLHCEIYAKCEFMNPAGSIKDRIVKSMIQDAKQRGIIHDQTEFVEPTSGNTGIGIAFNAALMDHKCIIVTQDKNSSEKVDTSRMLGAEVIQTKTNELEISIAHQLVDENSETMVMLNQFDNEVNPMTHYENTGKEIVSALGDIDVIVLGAGTGGTLTGVGRRLKEVNPNCVLVAAEPDGSIMFNEHGKPHPFLADVWEELLDEWQIRCNSSIKGRLHQFFPSVRERLERTWLEVDYCVAQFLTGHGNFKSGSSGAAMAAAIKAIKKLNIGAGRRVVVILPDGIRNYMSKFVSDQWMEAHRFMEPPEHTMNWWKHSLNELRLRRSYPKLNKSSTCKQVLEAMKMNNVNIAVIEDNVGHFVGAVSKNSLRNRATNPTKLPGQNCEEFDFEDAVTDHLDKHVYTLAKNAEGAKPTIGLLSRMLDITPFVVIGINGHDIRDYFKASFVVTGDDVLDYIHEHSQPCKEE